ncbi:hypothetical protein KGA65_02995 [Ideonella sp. B7]|nr:hypothetical protein [Ideonella benzenivorans]MCA6215503.1 hypothetical protein [Ideonella benzenivorans]
MGWLLLEALIAAGLLVFMVWWTMGSRRRQDAPADDDVPPDAPSDAP